MDMTYKSGIENPSMRRRLLVLDNIPAIEDLLDKESQRLKRLQKLKEEGRLNLGNTVSPEELRELFPQVCREVDTFLGIQGSDVPRCGYFNLLKPGIGRGILIGIAASLHSTAKSSEYNKLSKRITLERIARTDLIPTAGHEYTHHIQHKNGITSTEYVIFREGHARGVQRQLAEEYREREDNEAFLYPTSDRNTGELKSAYLWMCKKLGRNQRKMLLKTKTSRDSEESWYRVIIQEPTPHAIGNALLSIYESLHGKEIYKQMIHGDFQFA